ncbi:Hypothetical predicted protein [Mytilus galloprovincialis]|uniref:C-type lectin domain-containing protein n=1 Tax=Mytilus galloprovincialis TaxID=29158 RepID=A0A8B6DB94_MYTGA|nr:Hypothetical predicted protein [Mytilus galloprovincialis]
MQESGTVACEAINEFGKDTASVSIIVQHDGINGQQLIPNVNGIIPGTNGIDDQDTLTQPNDIFLINDVNEGGASPISPGSISQSCDGAFLGGFIIGRLLAPVPMADGTMMTTAQVMMMRLMSMMTGNPMAPMMCQPQPVTTPCPPMVCPPIKTAVCPPGWILLKKLCYKVFHDKETWDNANRKCKRENAILAEPDTRPEIDFLKILAKIPDTRCREDYWIGGKDRKPPTRDFVWTSRDVSVNIGATDWESGEPNTSENKQESCMEMRKRFNHKWNDKQCSRKQKYICQKRIEELVEGAFQNESKNDKKHLIIKYLTNACCEEEGKELVKAVAEGSVYEAKRYLCTFSKVTVKRYLKLKSLWKPKMTSRIDDIKFKIEKTEGQYPIVRSKVTDEIVDSEETTKRVINDEPECYTPS